MSHPTRPAMSALAKWLLSLALFAMAVPASAQAQKMTVQAGREYTVLNPPRPVATGARIEVIEFFYYGCPVCYEFQPYFSRWLFQAPGYVALRRVPALSVENWEPFATLYFTLDTLGELQRLHWPVYDNYHFDGIKLNVEKTALEWAVRSGIDRQKFLLAYHAEDMKTRLAQSRDLMKLYDIQAVPTVVVDGKFMTSARLAGGSRQLAQVVDELVKLARKERPN